MEIVLIVLPNILPMPFHSTFASVVFPFTALICKALSGNIWRIVLGILSAWNATKPSIGATGRVSRCGADSRMNLEMSDWYVENGSYVRLKNLTIGYTLPSEWTKKITINNLRFFVAAQNLFTITGYSGLDPEIGEINNSPLYKGCDMGFYPQPRTFMFGLSLKL